jgi:hypothetical protein
VKHRTQDGARQPPRAGAPPAGRNGRSIVTMRSGGVVRMKEAEKCGIARAIDACATIREKGIDPA